MKSIEGVDSAGALEGVWQLSVITQPGQRSVTYPDVPEPLYLYSVEASSATEREQREKQVEMAIRVEIQ